MSIYSLAECGHSVIVGMNCSICAFEIETRSRASELQHVVAKYEEAMVRAEGYLKSYTSEKAKVQKLESEKETWGNEFSEMTPEEVTRFYEKVYVTFVKLKQKNRDYTFKVFQNGLEKFMIVRALLDSDWIGTHAAKFLGVQRTALVQKRIKHKLQMAKVGEQFIPTPDGFVRTYSWKDRRKHEAD